MPASLTRTPRAVYRVILTALVVATKMTHDRALKVSVWARYSTLFTAPEVHRMECQFLALLDYRLCIDEPELLSASRSFMLNSGYEGVGMMPRSWSTTDLDLLFSDAVPRRSGPPPPHTHSKTDTDRGEEEEDDDDDQPNSKPFSRSVGLYSVGPQLAFLSHDVLVHKKTSELGLGPPLPSTPHSFPSYPSTNTLGSPFLYSPGSPMPTPGSITHDSCGSSPESAIITPMDPPDHHNDTTDDHILVSRPLPRSNTFGTTMSTMTPLPLRSSNHCGPQPQPAPRTALKRLPSTASQVPSSDWVDPPTPVLQCTTQSTTPYAQCTQPPPHESRPVFSLSSLFNAFSGGSPTCTSTAAMMRSSSTLHEVDDPPTSAPATTSTMPMSKHHPSLTRVSSRTIVESRLKLTKSMPRLRKRLSKSTTLMSTPIAAQQDRMTFEGTTSQSSRTWTCTQNGTDAVTPLHTSHFDGKQQENLKPGRALRARASILGLRTAHKLRVLLGTSTPSS